MTDSIILFIEGPSKNGRLQWSVFFIRKMSFSLGMAIERFF